MSTRRSSGVVRAGLICISLAVLPAANIAPAAAQSTSTETSRMLERTVSVSATGEVDATPDIAAITTGVQTEADTARQAMAKNTAAMTKLIEGLKVAGIAAKDIQTSSVNVSPRYANRTDGKPAVLTGYMASNQVRIIVRDIAKLGETLDAALSLGATQMGGIAFEASKAETLKDEARKTAMVNARRRAELYAAAAGASLGQVIAISEDAPFVGPPVLMAQRTRAAAGPVPVEAGTLQLHATVHVTWALK